MTRWRDHVARITAGVGLLERQTYRTVLTVAVLPVGDNLAGAAAMGHAAVFARLAGGHMEQDVLHGATMRQSALPHFHSGLLLLFSVAALALVGVQQQH